MSVMAIAQVALMAINMAINASRKIEGPRLESTKFTGGDYGAPVPMFWGKRRMPGVIFWAEDLREVKRRRKTKGGKYNEYTYYGTWACAIAAHEIDGITRIWFDTHLVFDLTGAGPITPFNFGDFEATKFDAMALFAGAPLSVVQGRHFNNYVSVYPGTDDQEVDERIQATTEAKHGEGSCPAYRGIAYIVFKDIPLEKLGNRIPQVSIEAVRTKTDVFPTSTVTSDHETGKLAFMPDYSFLLAGIYSGYALIDTAAGAIATNPAIAWGLVEDSSGSMAILSDGTILAPAGAGIGIRGFSPEGADLGLIGDTTGVTVYDVDSCQDIDGQDHWLGIDAFATEAFNFDGVTYQTSDLTGTAFHVDGMFADSFGGVWISGQTNSAGLPTASDTAIFHRIFGPGDGPDTVTVEGLPSASTWVVGHHYADATHDQFVFNWNGDVYAADRQTGAILASNTTLDSGPVQDKETWRFIAPATATMWVSFTEIRLDDLTEVQALDATDWGWTTGLSTIYDPINHALVYSTGSTVRWAYLDRVGSAGTTLGVIAADVADQVGVADYDFTALDQVVQGWSATQGQASNILEPLFDAYDSDIAPKDFSVIGIKRGGTASITLDTERFVVDGVRYRVKVRQAAELPRQLTYTFADIDADQQPNSIPSDRNREATSAADERSIDLSTFVSDTDTMRGLADRHFRRLWNERREASLSLTMQQLVLSPTDLRRLDLDGDEWPARCIKTTIRANGVIATEWKYDHPSLALLSGSAGAGFDGRDESVIAVPLLSKGFVLDIPLLSDVDTSASPLVYIAAAPYADGSWPGATAYQAVDGEYSDEVQAIPSSRQASWGYATDTLGAPVSPWLWDYGSSVNVMLQVGSLTGTTEAAIDADPTLNLALIGDEVVQFASATLEGDGSYTLATLKRGRRGTEWACATHGDRDVFLLLDTAEPEALGLSEVGTNLSFKAITAGRSTGFPIDIEPFTGASLKPYAPCHLEAVKESNGDWTLSWVRRTRVGGAWTSGTAIPLSEASEEYELDLSDGVDTVTKTVTSATTYTWTQAAQVSDVGAEVMAGDLEWSVFQISDAVDRGFEAAATA